jgi:betaine lipid synthase
VTRKALLKGREEMLALAAAQLRFKAEKQGGSAEKKRIWVDVGFFSFTRAPLVC